MKSINYRMSPSMFCLCVEMAIPQLDLSFSQGNKQLFSGHLFFVYNRVILYLSSRWKYCLISKLSVTAQRDKHLWSWSRDKMNEHVPCSHRGFSLSLLRNFVLVKWCIAENQLRIVALSQQFTYWLDRVYVAGVISTPL